jgi:hypothetical protein
MMGKQVRFFTMPSDEIEFFDFVSSLPSVRFIKRKTSHPKVEIIDRLSIETLSDILLRDVYIWKEKIPIPKRDIQEINLTAYNEEKMEFIETGEIAYFVSTNAPVIEFSRSFIRKDNNLVQGRIWCEFYRLTDDRNHLKYKGDDFKALYETLAGWIRKNFKKLKGVDGYFGKEALAWYRKGGQLFP